MLRMSSTCLWRRIDHSNWLIDVDYRVLDRWVPNSWQNTLRAFKEAATYKDDCKKQFPCANPQQEWRRSPQLLI